MLSAREFSGSAYSGPARPVLLVRVLLLFLCLVYHGYTVSAAAAAFLYQLSLSLPKVGKKRLAICYHRGDSAGEFPLDHLMC